MLRPTTAPGWWAQRLAPILAAIGVAVAAFVQLSHVNPAFRLSDDGIRDQLLVRDCTDLGQCHLIGAPSSISGLHHGAAWLDLLIATRLLGGDTSSARRVVLALLALSVATVFLVVWRWLEASIALPAAVLLTGALSLDAVPSNLINPSTSAFPDVLTAAGLLCYGLSGARRFLILSAFALGVGINVHLASLSLVPPLVAIAALGRPRPWRELIASIAVLVATCFITSRAALLANILGSMSQGWLIPALAGTLAIGIVSTWQGSRFRRLSWDVRAWAIGLILVLPFGFASLWLVHLQRHAFGFIYLHPILAPSATFAAAIVSLPFQIGARWRGALRWMPTAGALGGLAFMALPVERAAPGPSPPGSWTFAEARAIAEQAAKRSWSYEDLVFHLQSSACRELLVRMSVDAPPPMAAPRSDRRQLQVVRAMRDDLTALAGSYDVVPLGRGRVAVVREIESWLDPAALIACRRPTDSGRSPSCSAAHRWAPDTLTRDHFLFLMRSFPEIHGLDLPPPYIASYEVPLLPVAGEGRDVVVADHAVAGCHSWRITRVEGVQFEGDLPATHVRLHSENGSPGVLVVEKPFATTTCGSDGAEMRYPPCLFEARMDDPILALVGTR